MAGPVSEDNLLVWEALVGGPPGTPYECGVFKARLEFPLDYPMHPPKMYFTSAMWHPNIYPNGEVCISILHPPGEDPTHYEKVEERWSPVQSVEKILISVMSMLAGTCADVTALCLHVSETARRLFLLVHYQLPTQSQTMRALRTSMPPYVFCLKFSFWGFR